MSDKPPSNRIPPHKTAIGLTRFPSLLKWEDPWEAGVNLERLRGRAKQFQGVRKLAEDPRHSVKAPQIDRAEVERIATQLELDRSKTDQLIGDATLIWQWYLNPEILALLSMEHETLLEELKSATGPAIELKYLLEPITIDAEHLFSAMPALLNDAEIDMLAFVRSIGAFVRAAEKSVSYLTPNGRQYEARRNTALALATWAVEDATGEPVRISRGRRSCSTPHFTTPPGKFVAQLLHLLGRWEERILVRAFEEMRRPARAQKPD